jgi:hypothetical protein
MVYLGLYGFAWTDYDFEATPSYNALIAGHVWRFFQLAPGYGGSLELRAPFALLPSLWGGGEQAVYQLVALPCLIAAALLGIWLFADLRARGAGGLARWSVLALCAANPITIYACEVGHPEDLLGGVLAVAAVLSARASRASWAGVLLGLAIVNKEWGLLAVGPVLLALPSGRRRALGLAAMLSIVFYAPLEIAQLSGRSTGTALAVGSTGTIFQPWQVWWFLGAAGHIVRNSNHQILVGYRTPPGWIETITHPLIVALGVPLTALAAWRRRAGVRPDALLLLVLLLLLRAALDPWDYVYYLLPFIIALASWEALRSTRPPLLTLVAVLATWVVFEELPARHASADLQALAFLAVTIPALVALVLAIYRPATRLRTALEGRPTRRPVASSAAG